MSYGLILFTLRKELLSLLNSIKQCWHGKNRLQTAASSRLFTCLSVTISSCALQYLQNKVPQFHRNDTP
jgi:hypothetical protein